MADTTLYTSQDRGTEQEYNSYLNQMDAVSVEKVASCSAFFDSSPGKTIVDVGMASGTSSNILSHLFPKVNIVGVDINPKMVEIAGLKYSRPNLSFRIDDGETLRSFAPESVDGFFSCSSIHHITSYNDYDANRARNTIRRQTEVLRTGGIIVVRDFVKPPHREVILELSSIPAADNLSDADLLIAFSRSARSLASPHEQGFPLKEVSCNKPHHRRFQLFYADAVEFIRRKDYRSDWDIELQEEYGYLSQAEFEELFSSLGLRIVVSAPLYNPWIVRNRYQNQFTLFDKNLNDIGYPPTNFLIAGEKIKQQGTRIDTLRHLPQTEHVFLHYSSYQNQLDNSVYDVVARPQPVFDLLPYFIDDNTLFVVAKHGYPRPLANVSTDSPCIDGKHFSAYIIEAITAIQTNEAIEHIVEKRSGILAETIASSQSLLEYLPSAGGINEKVHSFEIQLKEKPQAPLKAHKKYSDFDDNGTIRCYDAQQLLRTAQTGALAEARLELNIYALFRKQGRAFPLWLGQKAELIEQDICPANLNDLLTKQQSVFKESSQSAHYLETFRAKFTELGIQQSASVMEYVIPRNQSINTLITLPLTRFKGEIYLGLELRDLPVAQIHFGSSQIAVAPAFRLSKKLANYKDLNDYIVNLQFGAAQVQSYCKLAEKFFPSIGLTPEQVYPYIVTLSNPQKSDLHWVKLSDVYKSLEQFHDGHLLICVMRCVSMFYAELLGTL